MWPETSFQNLYHSALAGHLTFDAMGIPVPLESVMITKEEKFIHNKNEGRSIAKLVECLGSPSQSPGVWSQQENRVFDVNLNYPVSYRLSQNTWDLVSKQHNNSTEQLKCNVWQTSIACATHGE